MSKPNQTLMTAIATRIDELLARLGRFPLDYDSNRSSQQELAAFQECCAATVSIGNSVYGVPACRWMNS